MKTECSHIYDRVLSCWLSTAPCKIIGQSWAMMLLRICIHGFSKCPRRHILRNPADNSCSGRHRGRKISFLILLYFVAFFDVL
jgi:hypothetical protein